MSQSNVESISATTPPEVVAITSDLLDPSSNYFDNMMWLHENAIAKETRLINEVHYILRETKKGYLHASVGLSAARGFIPVVRLFSARNSINFTRIEWSKLSTNFGEIHEEWAKIKKTAADENNTRKRKLESDDGEDGDVFGLNKKKEIRLEQFEMMCDVKLSDRYIIFESRNSRILLEAYTFKRLEKLTSMIDYRLSMLEVLDFPSFYDRVLKLEALMDGNILINIENLMLYPQNHSAVEPAHFENVHSMLDVLAHNPEKLKHDFTLKCMYNTIVENDSHPHCTDVSTPEEKTHADVVIGNQPKLNKTSGNNSNLLVLYDSGIDTE